jgi:DNA repair exonuclease SbcCD ATPase subunit/DNA repair exonuclease SbcCD nuclease subunit
LKFAHIADTHIKNLKYHYEYGIIFQKIYETLRKEKVDYIVHCGDIAHTKTQISPEFVEMCADFFRNLADIAPTYIILGNHDGNLRNSSRQDAITPIVEALENPNIHLLKNSGEVPLEGNIALNVLSVFDEDGWVKPSDKDRINIALYHGSVSGVVTDTGWVMTHGDHPVEIFDEFDYAFLGDIHKTNQSIDMYGKKRYPGSTVQQNHGETDDKGFLLWDIQSKDDFTCRHVEIKNPRPFVTVELTPKGKMPKGLKIPEKSRLRLVSKNNLPLDVMRKATDVAKRRFRPESVSFLNRAAGDRGNVEGITSGLGVEDLRNIKIQESLIKEYLKDYEPNNTLMKRILDLNLRYNKLAEENEEVSRNVNWKLRKLEFDNLFNYGENNSINFDNLEGIVGIFGKNFSGKSSIIDSLLYTIFNSTSKNDRKTVNVINQNKETAEGRVLISVGDTDYHITRNSEKYVKRLKGEESVEAKTLTTFVSKNRVTGETRNLNGLSRPRTDKNIRKMLGTLEDFLYSSMASQLDSLTFIKEGSTKRKEILAKFLDLKFFETKFKLAKEDASDTRGALKKLENRDFQEEVILAKEELGESNGKLEKTKRASEGYKKEISELDEEMSEISEKIRSVPAEIIDIVKVRKELRDKRNQMISVKSQNTEFSKNREDYKNDYEQIACFLEEFDEKSLYGKQEKIKEFEESVADLERELVKERKELSDNQKRVGLLSGIPCGTSFPKCKFIRDAYVSKASIPENEKRIENLDSEKEGVNSKINELDPKLVSLQIEKYNDIIDRKNELSNLITNCDLNIEKNNSAIENLLLQIDKLESEISAYELNKDAIENLEKLNSRLDRAVCKKESLNLKLKSTNSSLMELYKVVGSLEQKLQNIVMQKEEYLDLRKEFSAYDLYMRCMHPNGIAFDVIRKKLPVINEEIAKILANIVDFEVFFEDNGKRLDIFIKHPMYDPRPLEMGSGAEKTISAMAIRLALLSVSSLPKSDIFVLDEPGTALDEENMQGFIDILAIIRSYFKTVLLVSHLDSLKDCVDMQITIDKKKEYASVRE